MQVGTGSGPTYLTSSYFRISAIIDIGGVTQNGSGASSQMQLTGSTLSSSGGTAGLSGFAYIEGMSVGNYASINFQTSYSQTITASVSFVGGGGQNSDTNAKTAIKIYMSSGNINTGTASLYGISS